MRFVAILGTHSWEPGDDQAGWWHPKSQWSAYMDTHGLRHAKPHRPFAWSGDLDGTWLHRGNDWEVGAVWLTDYLDDLPYDWRNVVAHSHGGQLAMLAAQEIQMRSLIMIGTPVRSEIEKIAPRALVNIGTCVHVSDARWDWMGTLGAVFDGRWSLRRTFAVSGIGTLQLKGIGHSGLLSDPKHFPKWEAHGLIDILAGEPKAAA